MTRNRRGKNQDIALYGGTIFEHFGHLLLDLSRTYQLLRLFRRSKETIWFHYPEKTKRGSGEEKGVQEAGLDHKQIGTLLPSIGNWMQSVYGIKDFGHLGDLIGHAGEPSRREEVRAA